MREWWSASEIVGLPGMPTTVQGVKFQARRKDWRNQPRTGKGGGLEYHLRSLPVITQNYLIHQEASRIAPALATVGEAPLPTPTAEALGGGLTPVSGPHGTAHPTAHHSGELTAKALGQPGPAAPGAVVAKNATTAARQPGQPGQPAPHPEQPLGMVATASARRVKPAPGAPAPRARRAETQALAVQTATAKPVTAGATAPAVTAAGTSLATPAGTSLATPTGTPFTAPAKTPLATPTGAALATPAKRTLAPRATDDPADELPALNAVLTDWQRQARDARLRVLAWVDELTLSLGSQSAAIERVLALIAQGPLPAALAHALAQANERPRLRQDPRPDDRPLVTLSRGTLYRWLAARRQGPDALAPRPAQSVGRVQPPWVAPLLAIYQDPAKPTAAACWRQLRDLALPGLELPCQRTAEIWLTQRLPVAIAQWGRLGTRARRAIKPFVRRTTDGLWPMDIVAVDGHTFKAWVAHPLSGERFRPEITTYLDLATRRIVGCAAWVAESQYAIWLALRAMILNPHQGVPALHYSDNGAYTGDQHRSLLARLGIDQLHSLPGNPQANGAIERINRSLWLPAAKQLPLYAGKDMDKDAFKARKSQADKDGAGLVPWADFTAFLQEQIRAYNGREHASLTRNRTRLSPDHAWAEAVAEGWQPTRLDQGDLHDLLPSETRTCRRGEVRLPFGIFFSKDLDDYHGQPVRVGYDPADGAQVWVSDLRGRLIATAQRDGNARPYVSATAIEDARAKREAARIKRLEARIERVQAQETPVIDLRPAASATLPATGPAATLPTVTLPVDPQLAEQERRLAEARAALADLPDLVLPRPGEWVPDLGDRPLPPLPTVERRPDHEIRLDHPQPGLPLAPVAPLPGRHGIHYLDQLASDPERYQQWLRLKADAAEGQALDDREWAFIERFANSDYCQITERLFAQFNAQLAAQDSARSDTRDG